MIIGGKLTEINAIRPKEKQADSFEINISFDDFQADSEKFTILYTYRILYNDGIGSLSMKGQLFGKDDKKTISELEKQWKKDKKLPPEYVAPFMRALNGEGLYTSTMLSRLLGLPLPVPFPNIKM